MAKEKKKMKKSTKTLLGTVAAVALGAGVYFGFLRDSNAAEPDMPELPPGDDDHPDDPADPTPKGPTQPSGPKITRPAGDPPPGGCRDGWYDKTFWDAGGPQASKQRVIDVFRDLGYDFNGATKASGGFKTSGEVKRFQEDYNLLSKQGTLIADMGGLAMDGKVGPCTLSALQYLYFRLGAFDMAGAAEVLR